MRITYLIEEPGRIRESLRAVFGTADALQARGHQITVVGRGGDAPNWLAFSVPFVRSDTFAAVEIPASDIVIATDASTVEPAIQADRGHVVHFSQSPERELSGVEGPAAADIDKAYRSRNTTLITIATGQSESLSERLNREVLDVPFTVTNGGNLGPGELRTQPRPVRVGVLGCAKFEDIRTALDACALAHQAGLELEVVRVSFEPNVDTPAALQANYQVETHETVDPACLGDLYRSMDVFLGTTQGSEFPVATIEAMACGVPCVLTDAKSYQGLGSGQNALFVEQRDPAQMAEALVIAASHHAVRNELRTHGFKTAAGFQNDQHTQALEDLLLKALSPEPSAIAPQQAHATMQPQTNLLPPLPAGANALPPQASPQHAQVYTLPSTALPPTESEVSPLLTPSGLGAPPLELDSVQPVDMTPIAEAKPTATAPTESTTEVIAERMRNALSTCPDLRSLDTMAAKITAALDAEVAHQRGLMLYALGDIQGAASSLRRALEGSSDPAEVLNDYGVALYACGYAEEARAAFGQALQINTMHPEARSNLEDCIHAAGAAAH